MYLPYLVVRYCDGAGGADALRSKGRTTSVCVYAGRFAGVLLERSDFLELLTVDRLPTPRLVSRIFNLEATVSGDAEAMGLCTNSK